MSIKSDQVANALIGDVLSGHYRPGERLPSERDLVARFEANRGAVREAMAKVAQLGLAEVLPGGARVRERELASLDVIGYLLSQDALPDPALVDQILVVISNLVSLAATQVAQSASDQAIAEIRALLTPLESGDITDAEHGEARFALMQHIMQTSENLPLQLIARTLFEQFAPNISAVAEFAVPDRARYAIYARQLDNALRQRDIPAVRGTFDAFTELNRETMTRAFVTAQKLALETAQEALAR
jgi:GntR family transcriptional repressor for pyruvate dehydrogenase complex